MQTKEEKIKAVLQYQKANPEKCKIWQRNYRTVHKDRKLASQRKWYSSHKKEKRKKDKIYRKLHPEISLNNQFKRRYGISLAEYDKLLIEQKHKCAICGMDENKSKKRLAVDHNHKTKKIRGLLCDKCNIGIGLLSDSEEILFKALIYLKNNNKNMNHTLEEKEKYKQLRDNHYVALENLSKFKDEHDNGKKNINLNEWIKILERVEETNLKLLYFLRRECPECGLPLLHKN